MHAYHAILTSCKCRMCCDLYMFNCYLFDWFIILCLKETFSALTNSWGNSTRSVMSGRMFKRECTRLLMLWYGGIVYGTRASYAVISLVLIAIFSKLFIFIQRGQTPLYHALSSGNRNLVNPLQQVSGPIKMVNIYFPCHPMCRNRRAVEQRGVLWSGMSPVIIQKRRIYLILI